MTELRVCENCDMEFEGAAQARFCSAKCRKQASRARGERLVESIAHQPVQRMTESDEQAVRDHYGYSSSESRSKAERDAAAARMVAKSKGSSGSVELPSDIAEVWRGSEDTARFFIAHWGEDVFRGSALHLTALAEGRHLQRKREVQRKAVPSP